ncbi:sugar transferase [Gottfriedia endophytica]|uniref:sugar transferase n=1 Tax=Gottfriedia endophytica TaxID=2820819 RepID=UPI002AC36318|nr:sugar transferase [Gottfriedia endophytica]
MEIASEPKQSSLQESQYFTEKSAFYHFLKRTFDILGALLGLVLFSPIFLVIAFFIKLESKKGPVFFKQERVGKNGKVFNMYKFRSMVPDAEERLQELLKYNEISGAMFKIKNDPRLLKIGKFIRKTSLDEFPQLWNVIRGEMSLVGPRPPLPREVQQYTNYEKLRLKVIPGCTGLWQIRGRNGLNFHQMVELDLEYIKNRNFLFDLLIILKTFKVLVGSNGAY